MKKTIEKLSTESFGQSYSELEDTQQAVIESIAEQVPLAVNINDEFHEKTSLGDRVSDAIAKFGGSWTFIFMFFGFIASWITVNTIWLITGDSFDPYPFILLNLGLSSLAAFQAPIIMMSQNRQAAKDRIEQDMRYQTNLKIEIEIIRLHEKLDALLQEKNK
jgi:uncharacterized membrane protein